MEATLGKQVVNEMGFGPGRNLRRSFSAQFGAPVEEFVVDEGDESTFIRHFDTRNEGLPTPGQESRNMTFSAYVNPTKKAIRITGLKYDGVNDQVNSLRSGSEILQGIVNVGNQAGHDIYVDEDVSGVKLNNKYNVELAKLKILESGVSFYNKAGFYPENFEENYLFNQRIRATKLGRYKKKASLDDFNEALGANFTSETPLSEVGEYVRTKVRPGSEISDDFAEELAMLLAAAPFKIKDKNLKYKK